MRWRDGRAFALAFDGGPSVNEVARHAAALYLHENSPNTQAFPSLGEIQAEDVGWTAALLHGGGVAGAYATLE